MVIIYDGEYSGLETKLGHGILSIAAIELSNPRNIFYRECRLDSDQTFDPKALEVNGIHESELYSSSKASLYYSLLDFKDWILEINPKQKQCLVSQNNPKDLEHIENGYERIDVECPLSYRNLDFHSMAFAHHLYNGIKIPSNGTMESKIGLGYLSNFVGIPPEPQPHSTALAGAKQTAEIYSRLFFGKSLLEQFVEYEVPKYLKK